MQLSACAFACISCPALTLPRLLSTLAFPLAVIILYYIVPNISSGGLLKYRTQYMCIVYIVPDIYLWYNRASKREVNPIPASKAQQKAVSKYMKENYDEIKVRLLKGRKAEIKAHADNKGESMNSFIGRAIDETMERDKEGGGNCDGERTSEPD